MIKGVRLPKCGGTILSDTFSLSLFPSLSRTHTHIRVLCIGENGGRGLVDCLVKLKLRGAKNPHLYASPRFFFRLTHTIEKTALLVLVVLKKKRKT